MDRKTWVDRGREKNSAREKRTKGERVMDRQTDRVTDRAGQVLPIREATISKIPCKRYFSNVS